MSGDSPACLRSSRVVGRARAAFPRRSEPESPAWTPRGLSPAVRDGGRAVWIRAAVSTRGRVPFLLGALLRGGRGSSVTAC